MKATIGLIVIFIVFVQNINAGHYIDEYYFSHPIKLSWWEASRFCTFYGKELIAIPNEREHINIRNAITSIQQNDSNISFGGIWTSGIRFPDEKSYYWEISGLPIIYGDWAPGDPQMSATEKCIFLSEADNFKLADGGCDARFSFVCKTKNYSF